VLGGECELFRGIGRLRGLFQGVGRVDGGDAFVLLEIRGGGRGGGYNFYVKRFLLNNMRLFVKLYLTCF